MSRVVWHVTMSLDGFIAGPGDDMGWVFEFTAQHLDAGLLDEIVVQVVPVMLSEGVRLFDRRGGQPIRLEKTIVGESGQLTDLRSRVLANASRRSASATVEQEAERGVVAQAAEVGARRSRRCGRQQASWTLSRFGSRAGDRLVWRSPHRPSHPRRRGAGRRRH
jgi:hypothetical protein